MNQDNPNIKITVIKKKHPTKYADFVSFFVSIASLLIAMFSLYIAYQSSESSREYANHAIEHNKKSVQPLLNLYPKGEKDTKEYGIYLSNQGLGPARIISIKINEKNYSKVSTIEWLDLFYDSQLTNNYQELSSGLRGAECEQYLQFKIQEEIESIQKSDNSELSKNEEIKQLKELQPFFQKSCSNPNAAQKAYSFWECLKVGSIQSGAIIRTGAHEKILEVIYSKLDNIDCTQEIVSFSKWLINVGFEIGYESPLYDDESLKNRIKIHNF
ncbi:hypothetical protein [Uruburuella suis]|uniref:hypothetical protein n=1 Tax=Uruburuella suis TaxID=252130 RepID=UPI003F4A9AB9